MNTFIRAVQQNNTPLLKVLVLDKSLALLRNPSNQYLTPIHYMVDWNCDGLPDLIEYLLSSGGDINARNNNQRPPITPLDYAVLRKNPVPSQIRWLLEHGAKLSDTHSPQFSRVGLQIRTLLKYFQITVA